VSAQFETPIDPPPTEDFEHIDRGVWVSPALDGDPQRGVSSAIDRVSPEF